MPVSEPRTAWCGCVITPTTQVCPNCDECMSCCACHECSNCHRRFYEEDFCPECQACNDHCSCKQCETCGKRFKERDGYKLCRNCYRCPECCDCYRCTVCRNKVAEEKFCSRCNRCEDHCTCYVCQQCGVRQKISNFCELCQMCKEHCTCLTCITCNSKYRVEEKCTEEQEDGTLCCGRCRGCCKCKVFGVEYRKGTFRMYDSVFAKGQFKRNRLSRHISVEIEVDKYNTAKNARKINEALDRWGDAVVHDGSLSGHGIEINTNPCNGDLWYKHIEELCNGLELINAGCTSACGLHCHVNAKDLSAYDLRRLILLYRKTERGLFELCEPRRMQGHYSQVCGAFFMLKNQNPDEFRRELAQKMYLSSKKLPTPKKKGNNTDLVSFAKTIDRAKKEKYRNIRYKALNLHSFYLRGTVEFRHKEGTVDYTEITNWGEICANLLESAANWPESRILALPGDVRVLDAPGEPAVVPITSSQSREALMAVLPRHLQDFAERKWASMEKITPRYKAQMDETWLTHGNNPGPSAENF